MSELTHWSSVVEKYNSTLNFIEWLEETYCVRPDFDDARSGTPLSIKALLDEFYEVNQEQLENERRQLLEMCRNARENSN